MTPYRVLNETPAQLYTSGASAHLHVGDLGVPRDDANGQTAGSQASDPDASDVGRPA